EADVPIRVCGEMGGRPLEAMALIGIGIEDFSITPAAVGSIKGMIRSLDVGKVRTRVEQLLDKPPANMRKALGDWARRHGVAIA
ncbi:MAG TPA: putative PEP-binding protein, partial [Sphingomicrobium sp.]|nr:putative PEP-binding protein [Sphingomicrobium sp.]